MQPALIDVTPIQPHALLESDRLDQLTRKISKRISDNGSNNQTEYCPDDYYDTWDSAHVGIVNTLLGGQLRQTFPVKVRADTDDTAMPGTVTQSMDRHARTKQAAIGLLSAAELGTITPEAAAKIKADIIDRMPTGIDWIRSGMIGKTRAGRAIERLQDKLYSLWQSNDIPSDIYETARESLAWLKEANYHAAESVRKVAELTGQTLTLHLSADPVDIERLGMYKPCRTSSSCYRRGGQFGLAPLSLLTVTGSFVALLADAEGNYIARAWGVWDADQSNAMLTNLYPHAGSPAGSILLDTFGEVMAERGLSVAERVTIRSDEDADGIYLNADSRGYSTDATVTPRFTLDAEGIEARYETCECCSGEYSDTDEGIYVEGHGTYGPCCHDEAYLIDGYYYPAEDVVLDYADEPILSDGATELYDGSYASDGHCDLVELHDGSYAIDGYHDVVRLHDGSYGVSV